MRGNEKVSINEVRLLITLTLPLHIYRKMTYCLIDENLKKMVFPELETPSLNINKFFHTFLWEVIHFNQANYNLRKNLKTQWI